MKRWNTPTLDEMRHWEWSQMSNRDLSEKHQVNREKVRNARIALGVEPFVKPPKSKPEPDTSNLKALSDKDIVSDSWKASFWRFVRKETSVRSKHVSTPCWIWMGSLLCTQRGKTYGRMNVQLKDRILNALTHRLSFIIHHGPIPAGKLVRHTCDEKLCVNPGHLVLGTYAENGQDTFDRMTLPRGTAKPSAKLNDDLVKDARDRFSKGESLSSISKSLGVHFKTIQTAIDGRSWRHVL